MCFRKKSGLVYANFIQAKTECINPVGFHLTLMDLLVTMARKASWNQKPVMADWIKSSQMSILIMNYIWDIGTLAVSPHMWTIRKT